MPKLVVIDPSLLDYQGHYFEYAARVLRAAAGLGFEPVLVANRRVSPDCTEFRTLAAYRYGFWYSTTPAATTTPTAEPEFPRWRSRLFRALFHARYSSLGIRCASLHPRAWRIERHAWRERASAGLVLRHAASFLGAELRTALAVAGNCAPYRETAGRAMEALCRYITRVRREVKRGLRESVAIARQHLGNSGALRQLAWRQWKLRHFVRDTCRWLDQESLSPGDMVLLTVASQVEVMALASVIQRRPECLRATWHLVFRHNLHARGEAEGYNEQQRPLRNALRHLAEHAPVGSVHCHTDTEELTAQHDALGGPRFYTLPVPVGGEYFRQRRDEDAKRPLQITYIGDARAEKGYHLLPALVADLWERWVATGRARFVVQSNDNAGRVAPEIAIARAQLRSYGDEQVTLLTTALTPDEYREQVLAADVMLLPYDGERYFARSSGILSEALTAGVPVVVPGGTWMARQLARPHFDYHQTLLAESPIVASRPARDRDWTARGERAMSDGCLRLFGRDPRAWTVRVPRGATALLVVFCQQASAPGQFVELRAQEFDANGQAWRSSRHVLGGGDGPASLLTRLRRRTREVRLHVRNAYATLPLELTNWECHFLQATERVPLGAVGAVFYSPRELRGATEEILRHAEHYRATAAAHAEAWARRHTAERLVQTLIETALSTHTHTPLPRPHFLPAGPSPVAREAA